MENSKTATQTKLLVVNSLIAAAYLAITIIVTPFAQGAIQLRVSESLNHLVVFNRKLMWGVLGGVVIYNMLFSGWLDVLFGGGQTLIALSITVLSAKWIKDEKLRMVFNTLIFSVTMILIAILISILSGQALGSSFFWATYGSLFISEAIMMGISIPIMLMVNQAVKFSRF
ncbi:QueT transporter family protein [Vagococcus silagei]|uniref:QueT transporter family protein n=1 Tax=Vagococcus silagei TaxID=2508885 RepID=A0A4S3B8K2_9ENTE|nr:QueT transporter family protein [Vagococcus silagei]THB62393.1 QueT transporter family protein [Vagococcus silagei]